MVNEGKIDKPGRKRFTRKAKTEALDELKAVLDVTDDNRVTVNPFTADNKAREPEVLSTATVIEDLGEKVELLCAEWVMTGGEMKVFPWLMDVKGYSNNQASTILHRKPSDEWYEKRRLVEQTIVGKMVETHTELMTKVNEKHVEAASMGLEAAVKLLRQIDIKPLVDSTGQPCRSPKDGGMLYEKYSPKDLTDALVAVEKAQKIARTAFGLGDSSEGLIQVLRQLQSQTTNNVQININNSIKPENEFQKQISGLQYEDVLVFIEAKRQKMKTISDSADASKKQIEGTK